LRWDVPVERVDCNRLLPLCAVGLSETEHPFALLARTAFRDILAIRPSVASGTTLADVIRHVRAALMRSESACQEAAMLALRDLSAAAGDALTEHLHSVLPALSRLATKSPRLRDTVHRLCEVFESNSSAPVETGGIIKGKIPTYAPASAVM
jgi:hypothetical protein